MNAHQIIRSHSKEPYGNYYIKIKFILQDNSSEGDKISIGRRTKVSFSTYAMALNACSESDFEKVKNLIDTNVVLFLLLLMSKLIFSRILSIIRIPSVIG